MDKPVKKINQAIDIIKSRERELTEIKASLSSIANELGYSVDWPHYQLKENLKPQNKFPFVRRS